MYLSELLAGLARRWWLVVLGLLATVALSVGAAMLVPTQQAIQATMLVLPPKPLPTTAADGTVTTDPVNPFLELSGLAPAADVLARAMAGGAIQDELAPPGSTGTFEVVRDTSMSGPALLITATDRTAGQATALLDKVVARMPSVFADVQTQAGVTPSTAMTLTQVARDAKPTVSNKSQVRAILVAAVGGLVLTLLGTNLVDGLILRRKALRESRATSSDDSAAPPSGPLPWDPVPADKSPVAQTATVTRRPARAAPDGRVIRP